MNAPDFIALAEQHGAVFSQNPRGYWTAKDSDGMMIITGCMSKEEAAKGFCDFFDFETDEPVDPSPGWLERLIKGRC